MDPPPSPRTDGVLPAAPRVEHASAYASVAQGPALTPEESERTILAVEVRLLWGADLIRVEHLDPPRSYHAGEVACDLSLSRDLLGADRVTLVRADGSGVSAVVPSGVTARVQTGSGQPTSIEGAAGGTPVLLAPDARVTLTLPARADGAAYRASPGDGEAPQTSVVVEIALVRAGRIVGRGIHLPSGRAALRFVAATLLAAAATCGVLVFPAFSRAPIRADPGHASDEQVVEIAQRLQAIAEREPEEPAEPSPDPRWWRNSSHQHYDLEPLDSYPVEDGPYGEVPWLDALPGLAEAQCADRPEYSWPSEPTLDQRPTYCASPVATPFGLRALGLPASPDPLGRDVHDLWPLNHTHARNAAHTAHKGAVHLRAPLISGRLPPEVIARTVRQNLGRLRLCYTEALGRVPALTGRITLRFVIGRDGALSTVANGGSDMPDGRMLSCVVSSFRGISFPIPESGIVVVTQAIVFSPGP